MVGQVCPLQKNKRTAGPGGGGRACAQAPEAGAPPAGLGGLCDYGNTGLGWPYGALGARAAAGIAAGPGGPFFGPGWAVFWGSDVGRWANFLPRFPIIARRPPYNGPENARKKQENEFFGENTP